MAKRKFKKTQEEELLDENLDFGDGRIAPNAIDLESKILGAILIDNQVMNDVVQIIDYKHFYRPANGIIFQGMINLDTKKEAVDPHTLKEELKRMDKLEDVGGIEYIIELTTSVSTSANVEYYTRIVYEKYILRNLINISSRIVDKCFDPTINTFTVLDEAEQKILDISESLSKKKVVSVSEELEHLIGELADQRSNKSGITGIPTGYTILDDMTAGFQKSELVIIAGRPSHGKTAFSMNIARNAAVDHNKAVGIFSLEMSFRELILRLLAGEARVNGKALKTGKSSIEDWNRVLNNYHKLKTKLYIDDSSELSILELRAKARRMKQEYNIEMVLVDYLQLVKGPDNSERRDLEVAYVSRGLKALAKELDIPVVACAQLNRGIEQRGKEKRPQLADLRESGAIEQDADVVIFVHRPIMGMKHDTTDPNYEELKRKAEIVIGKQRNGPTGDFELIFLDEYAKFENKIKHPSQNIIITGLSTGVSSGMDCVTISYSQTTGITNINGSVPGSYRLHQNYPNPFNPSTVISFDLAKESFVNLTVYNAAGKEMTRIVNSNLNAGSYKVDFNGSGLNSGVYFYKLTAGEFTETRTMILVK